MTDIVPAPFNPIGVMQKLSYHFGNLLSDKLASLRTPTYPYKISTPVSDGVVYTVNLLVTNQEENTSVVETLTYTATPADDEVSVLTALAAENTNDNVYVDLDTDQLELSFTAANLHSVDNDSAPVGLEQTENAKWIPNGIPASYIAYDDIPRQDFPYIVLSILPITDQSINFGYGSRQVDTDPDEYEVYTDRYLNFSVQLTCDAGKMADVLNSGGINGSSYILNTLLARLGDTETLTPIEEDINCVYQKKSSILPNPLLNGVNYNDESSLTLDFTTIDQNISNVGTFDTVIYDADYYDYEDGNLVTQSVNRKVTIRSDP